MYLSIVLVTVPSHNSLIDSTAAEMLTVPPQPSTPLTLFNQVSLTPATLPLHTILSIALGELNTGGTVSIIITSAYLIRLLPQSSVAVMVYGVTVVRPHLGLGAPATVVTVRLASHASANTDPALLATHAFIRLVLSLPPHAKVRFCGAVIIKGFVKSTTVNVAWAVLLLPQLSVTVHTTVTTLPGLVHEDDGKAVKSLLTLTPLHTSPAVYEFNHVCTSAFVLSLPQSTVIFAGAEIVGTLVSSIVKLALVVFVLPHASLTVNITVVVPVKPHPSLNPLKLLLHVNAVPLQASLATAPALAFNHPTKLSTLPLPSHCTVLDIAVVAITGLVVSCTTTLALHTAILPAVSRAVNSYILVSLAPH
jgi:hypothetical protein